MRLEAELCRTFQFCPSVSLLLLPGPVSWPMKTCVNQISIFCSNRGIHSLSCVMGRHSRAGSVALRCQTQSSGSKALQGKLLQSRKQCSTGTTGFVVFLWVEFTYMIWIHKVIKVSRDTGNSFADFISSDVQKCSSWRSLLHSCFHSKNPNIHGIIHNAPLTLALRKSFLGRCVWVGCLVVNISEPFWSLRRIDRDVTLGLPGPTGDLGPSQEARVT